ncbi:glutamate cyclase domain-containing protein [Microbulbifer sp. Q7]|uniref:glutamate cyclase domain-containing protein n=1 Tax=Microbulbifer sp. Q7 TaxID=1785091 RepID=UPI00082B7247|nr:glutamate cyclase domain-containing protein [Microbulbifer sp. Q7]
MASYSLNIFRRPDTVHLANQIEGLLVAGNLRGMETVRSSGYRGYLLPAAQSLLQNRQRVAIVSGFPVAGQYETDGPAGAIAMARSLRALGSEVALLGIREYAEQLTGALPSAVSDGAALVDSVVAFDRETFSDELPRFIKTFAPTLIIFIEVPGSGADGHYRNMRFDPVDGATLPWEQLLSLAECPSLAIADGGNELGMGRLREQLQNLPVSCATATTDQLVIADVSNWGAYGLLGLASVCIRRPLLDEFVLTDCLEALVAAGMVDGVTGCNIATEDGLPLVRSQSIYAGIQALSSSLIPQRGGTPVISQTSFAARTA